MFTFIHENGHRNWPKIILRTFERFVLSVYLNRRSSYVFVCNGMCWGMRTDTWHVTKFMTKCVFILS